MPQEQMDNPVQDFLSAFFASRNMKANAQLGQNKLALEQARFNAEQANHQADMKQRADQFAQELALRKAQQDNTESYQKSMLDETRAQRVDASQERFRAAGGQLINTPDPTKTQTDTIQGSLPQVPGITVPPMAPTATQPVGPTQPDQMTLLNSGANAQLPQGMLPPPSVTSTVNVPVGEQMRQAGIDPTRYAPTQAPLGTPAGQSAYFPTLKGKVEEAKEAENDANQMEITPELASAMPGAGLQVGAKLDRRMIPIIQKGLEYKQSEAEHIREFGETIAQRRQAEQDSMQMKQALLALKANQSTSGTDIGQMYAESAIDDPDAKIPLKYQPNALAYIRAHPQEFEGIKSLPSEMGASEKLPFQAAAAAIDFGNKLKEGLKDPLIANNLGPIMGPVQDLTKRLGDDPRFKNNPGAIEKMQQFRSEIVGNFVNELKAVNPRAAASLQGLVDKMAPKENMTPAMFEGAINGMQTVAYNRIKTVRDTQFGGKAPSRVMDKYQAPQQPIANENPLWRKQGDKNFIAPDTSMVVTDSKGNKKWIYHDGGSDKFYPMATLPPDVK